MSIPTKAKWAVAALGIIAVVVLLVSVWSIPPRWTSNDRCIHPFDGRVTRSDDMWNISVLRLRPECGIEVNQQDLTVQLRSPEGYIIANGTVEEIRLGMVPIVEYFDVAPPDVEVNAGDYFHIPAGEIPDGGYFRVLSSNGIMYQASLS